MNLLKKKRLNIIHGYPYPCELNSDPYPPCKAHQYGYGNIGCTWISTRMSIIHT